MSLRTIIFGDDKCHRCGRLERACICLRDPKRAATHRQPRETPARRSGRAAPKFGR